jgi:hypothetical protein
MEAQTKSCRMVVRDRFAPKTKDAARVQSRRRRHSNILGQLSLGRALKLPTSRAGSLRDFSYREVLSQVHRNTLEPARTLQRVRHRLACCPAEPMTLSYPRKSAILRRSEPPLAQLELAPPNCPFSPAVDRGIPRGAMALGKGYEAGEGRCQNQRPVASESSRWRNLLFTDAVFRNARR